MVLASQFQQDQPRVAEDCGRLKGGRHAVKCNEKSLLSTRMSVNNELS